MASETSEVMLARRERIVVIIKEVTARIREIREELVAKL